jgi:hypothetical protein
MRFSLWHDRSYVVQLSLYNGGSATGAPVYERVRPLRREAAERELGIGFPEANDASFDFDVSTQ